LYFSEWLQLAQTGQSICPEIQSAGKTKKSSKRLVENAALTAFYKVIFWIDYSNFLTTFP